MATLTFFTVTGVFTAVAGDSIYDSGADPDLIPITGSVRFTPMIGTADSLQAESLSPPTNLKLAPITARIKKGVVTTSGVAGVRLPANSAVLNIDGDLFYQVEFLDLVARGEKLQIESFILEAPVTDVTVDLVDVARVAGSTVQGVIRGPRGFGVDLVTRVGNTLRSWVQGTQVGNFDISDLIFNGTYDSITDATTIGKALGRAASQAAARNAAGAVPVVEFNGTTWPARPADSGPVFFKGGIAPGNPPPMTVADMWFPAVEDGTVAAAWSAITGKPAGVDALLNEFASSGKLTAQTVDLAATDTTLARSAAGRITVEGSPVLTPVELAALSAKTALVAADLMALFDSEASGAAKKISLTSLLLWLRANEPDVLTAGEGSMPRDVATTTATLTSQSLRLRYFTAKKTETVTKARTYAGSTAAGATPTLCRVGIYSVDASTGDLILVASTPNDTTLWATASTTYDKSLSASWSKVAGTRYAVGVLCVTSATAPTIVGNAIGASSLAARAPRLTGAVAGQSDLPSSVSAGSVSASTGGVFVEMLP